MSDQEVLLRKGKLTEDFVAAKTRLRMLQNDARGEAKVLEVIVSFLRSGGSSGQLSIGMPPETYLSQKLATLINDLSESLRETEDLRQQLSGIGINVE
jgi:hypothetical protein